ncbi:MAG TPA: alpha/beta hydrolase [Ktedonobacteraceae bacterium]|nr:alpha/beta hydrolase [Ktedonobacteraceae bacterium]
MPLFYHDGLAFNYFDRGEGIPFIFQHGLGADLTQVLEVYEELPGFRLIAFDCRGHGKTHPPGEVDKLNFATFANDLRALMDHLEIDEAVIGGISMGAGVALNFTLRFPERVRGLILSRPAWLDKPLPDNLKYFPFIASLIQQFGAQAGREHFQASHVYSEMLATAPYVARSMIAQFEHPRAEETVAKLEKLPGDAPNQNRAAWLTITVPTLVLISRMDPVHPYEFGEILAQAIPQAQLRELMPKSINIEQHNKEAAVYIAEFLQQHFKTVERRSQC